MDPPSLDPLEYYLGPRGVFCDSYSVPAAAGFGLCFFLRGFRNQSGGRLDQPWDGSNRPVGILSLEALRNPWSVYQIKRLSRPAGLWATARSASRCSTTTACRCGANRWRCSCGTPAPPSAGRPPPCATQISHDVPRKKEFYGNNRKIASVPCSAPPERLGSGLIGPPPVFSEAFPPFPFTWSRPSPRGDITGGLKCATCEKCCKIGALPKTIEYKGPNSSEQLQREAGKKRCKGANSKLVGQ